MFSFDGAGQDLFRISVKTRELKGFIDVFPSSMNGLGLQIGIDILMERTIFDNEARAPDHLLPGIASQTGLPYG